MAGAKNKHKDHQTSHRKAKYAAQRDRTPINKAINVARHIARYGDTKQKDVLRGMAKMTLVQAARKLFERGAEVKGKEPNSLPQKARVVLLQLAM